MEALVGCMNVFLDWRLHVLYMDLSNHVFKTSHFASFHLVTLFY